MSFSSYLQKRGLGKSSVDTYVKLTRNYESWLAHQQLSLGHSSAADVLSYLEQKREGRCKPSYRASIVRVLQSYYQYHGIKNNPAAQIKIQGVIKPPIPELLEESELEELYRSHPQISLLQLKRKAMLGLLVYQAAETGELKKIKHYHLAADLSAIRLLGSRSQSRNIKIQKAQKSILKRYLAQKTQNESESLFDGSLKEDLAMINRHCQEIYEHYQNLFQIRASRIGHWIKEYNIRQAQYYAGHKHIGSTEKYETQSMQDLRVAIEQHNKM